MATLRRPLAEYGREPVKLASKEGKRSNWTYAPLTLANIDNAVARAMERLQDNPELIAIRLQLGRERSSKIQVRSLTGLRLGEVASLCLGNLYFDALPPDIKLDWKSEKNRQGNSVFIRNDLAESLSQWIVDCDITAHEVSRNVVSMKFVDEARTRRAGHWISKARYIALQPS